MADSLKPPPLTEDFKEDDDDNEDLFVSAIEVRRRSQICSRFSYLVASTVDAIKAVIGG